MGPIDFDAILRPKPRDDGATAVALAAHAAAHDDTEMVDAEPSPAELRARVPRIQVSFFWMRLTRAQIMQLTPLACYFLPAQVPVCFGMTPLANGYDKTAARIIRARFFATLGFTYEEVMHSTIQDCAALGVATELGHDRDPCEMHQDDKPNRAGFGYLTRSKNGVVINPFPECQDLLSRLHKLGVHFSFSTRFDTMILMLDTAGVRSPRIRIAVDLNTTRVSACLNLIHSALRMHKLLLVYAAANPLSPVAKVSYADYVVLAQLEAIARCSATCAVLVQTEQYFTKAIGFPLHMRMLEQLRADTFTVIHLDAITESPVLVRREMAKEQLTTLAREALRRTTLEAERRHCGNLGDELSGANVVMSDSAKLATLLDPRTCTCMHLPEDGPLAREEFAEQLVPELKEAYIEYGFNAARFWEAKAKRAEAPAPVVVEPEAEPDAPPPPRVARPNAFGFSAPRASVDVAVPPPESEAAKSARRATAARNATSKLRCDLASHFDIVHNNYVLYCSEIDWRALFPDLNLPADGDYDLLDDLIEADVTVILDAMIRADPDRARFGYLPYMATGSKASVGAFLASSYAERVNSAGNLILTKGNTLLADDEIDMCVVLRMNRNFMAYMRKHFGHISRQQFRATVVTGAQNNPPEPDAPSRLSQIPKKAGVKAAPAAAAASPRASAQGSLHSHFAPRPPAAATGAPAAPAAPAAAPP